MTIIELSGYSSGARGLWNTAPRTRARRELEEDAAALAARSERR